MSSLSDLRPGDIAIGPIHGFTGAFVGMAQLALATVEPGLIWRQGVKEWFRKRHAGVITEASRTLPAGTVRHRESGRYFAPDEHGQRLWRDLPMGDYDTYETGVITAPKMVQAMPGGAEEIELRQQTHWTSEWTFIRPEYITAEMMGVGGMDSHGGAHQGRTVAEAARRYVGTPYDFATYAAIPPYRAGVRGRRIEHIISGRDTMMCSRLVDACLADAGYHLFDDGRLEGNVTPSELYRRLRQLPHKLMIGGSKGFGFVPGWFAQI